MLKARHDVAMKAQMEAELLKHKNQLMERISDVVLAGLYAKTSEKNCKADINMDKQDLNKLLGRH
jgi:hypothetical protein